MAGMAISDMSHILRSLEESFQLLKARGVEPSDRHFDRAHKIQSKIRSDQRLVRLQSFHSQAEVQDASEVSD
jgi:hypothetical protein